MLGQVDLEWFHVDFAVGNRAHNRSKPAIFDSTNGLYDPQVLARVLVLWNGGLRWCMVLLVTQQNVIQEGTVRREERAGDLERLRVPKLRLLRFLRLIELGKTAYLFL